MSSNQLESQINIDAEFYPDHAALFDQLQALVVWDESMAARKTASFGHPYHYSQMRYAVLPIPECLQPLLRQLHDRLRIPFNNCLLNYYETGNNTMGFHSDDTSGLVPGTGVAIVSLGSQREITYRSIQDPSIEKSHALVPGSMLYMDDAVQKDWLHAIRRHKGAGPRISLTWRAIPESGGF
jgi:alkylated DNA repair dioxygenase AlkB